MVTGVLTAGWAVALVVLLVLRDRIPAAERWWIWTCATGLVMGLFGLWYVPRVKRGRARAAARRQQARAQDPAAGGGPGGRETGLPVPAQLWSSVSNTVSSTDTPGRSMRS